MDWWVWLLIAFLATGAISDLGSAFKGGRKLSDADRQLLSDIRDSLRRVERLLKERNGNSQES